LSSTQAVLRRDGRFSNVFRRVHDAKAVAGACCVADPKRCPKCPRFTRASSSYPTIADANRAGAVAAAPSTSLGRLAFWDVDAMLKNYGPAVWGRKYAERNPQAWRRNYVGVAGVLPEKREWLPSFTKDIKDGRIATVLDAGAGTCSLDALLRRHRARERVRLVSFGFYDCSMARVCGERGSLILDWSWLDPLPFCAKCTFDLVFQAEGMHHTAPDALPAERDRVCGPSRRLGATRGVDDGRVDGRRLAAADGATRRAGNVAAGNRTADARRALRGRKRGGSWTSGKNSKTEKHVSRASHSGLACAQKLWRAAFDHLGAAVACGGVLYVTDLLGDVYDGKAKDGPRCWSEFGARWAKANGYATVRAMSGAPCTQHYPALHVKKAAC
jgi:SAM-dependent methyltransferase